MVMRVHLLYFASFRDIMGRDQEAREVPAGTRVGDLWQALTRDVSRFAAFPSMPPAAVNREYADGNQKLADGDEVAFLPPVAGG